jgi:hypothetical protein
VPRQYHLAGPRRAPAITHLLFVVIVAERIVPDLSTPLVKADSSRPNHHRRCFVSGLFVYLFPRIADAGRQGARCFALLVSN